MNRQSKKFYAKYGCRFAAFALAAAMTVGELHAGTVFVSAEETGGVWKKEIESALHGVQKAESEAGDYAGAKDALKKAYDSLEGARHVDGLKVSEVGTDYIKLQWNAFDMTGNLFTDDDELLGYNVYWADTNEETTKFQLLDANGNNYNGSNPTIAAGDAQVSGGVVTFTVKMPTFRHLYFKVAIVTKALGAETQTDAVMSPTAVDYDTQIESLSRGMTATVVSNGIYLNWRYLIDDLDGGYTATGLTGNTFHVYRKRNGAADSAEESQKWIKIAEVKNSTNYLDEGRTVLKEDTYKLVPVDQNGQEISGLAVTDYTIFKEETTYNAGKDVAYLEIPLQKPQATTIRETYGVTELSLGKNLGDNPVSEAGYRTADDEITYSAKDTTVVDVDNDGEYEYLVEWDPSYGTDVSTQGYTGKQYIDCYELDGTLRWRLDLGVNIRSGSHYTEMGAFDYEGDGKAELMIKTAPGSRVIRYALNADGKNELNDDGSLKVVSEDYITIPAEDKAAGVTDQSSYVYTASDYRNHLIEMFKDWGTWGSYSEETRKAAIMGHWDANLVNLLTVSEKWNESTFYTGIAKFGGDTNGNVTIELTGEKEADLENLEKVIAANQIGQEEADKLRSSVCAHYDEGAALVNVSVRDENGDLQYTMQNSAKVSQYPLMKTVLVSEVKNYPTGEGKSVDLSGVAEKSGGYTQEEAELLADYFLGHYQYRMPKHDLNAWEGYIISGPEYITLFDCETGAELDTQPWYYGREDDGMLWGDYALNNIEPGNRCDRFNVAMAYLDGKTPACVMGRGYYTRTTMAAYNVIRENGQRKLNVVDAIDSGWNVMDNPFNSNPHGMDGCDEKNGELASQGDHYIAVADVNLDGRQDIINGGAIVSYDMALKKLYVYSSGGDYLDGGSDDPETTRGWAKYGHGDAIHITDMDPDHPGLEIASCFEGAMAAPYNWAVRDARTNTVLFGDPGTEDFARLMIGDVMPDVKGLEVTTGYAANGEKITLPNRSMHTNMNIRWAADMTTQFFGGEGNRDNVVILGAKDGVRYDFVTLKGCGVNGTKGTPDLMADLFGDARDEILIRTLDSSALRIYMNTEVSKHKNYTLMQNPQYRAGAASQNSSYSQPPYPDYYYASDTNWKYVTIPNQKKDQEPGAVTKVWTDDREKEAGQDWQIDKADDEEEMPEPEAPDPDEATGALLWSEDFEGETHRFQLLTAGNSANEWHEMDTAIVNQNKSGRIYGVGANGSANVGTQAAGLSRTDGIKDADSVVVSLDIRLDAIEKWSGRKSFFSLLGTAQENEVTASGDYTLNNESQILTIAASGSDGTGNNTGDGWWETITLNVENIREKAIVGGYGTQNTSNGESGGKGGLNRDTTGWMRLIAAIDFQNAQVDVVLKRISDKSDIFRGTVPFVNSGVSQLDSIFMSASRSKYGGVFIDNISVRANDAAEADINIESLSIHQDRAVAKEAGKTYSAAAWANADTQVAAMLVKLGMFADNSTADDYDAVLVNRMLSTKEALDAVLGMPLADTTEGDSIYALAEQKVDDVKYSQSSRNRLDAAMKSYKNVKESLDIAPSVQAACEVTAAWLAGVDTEHITAAYSNYFDFNYTAGDEFNAIGWTAVNAANEDGLYTAKKGYGVIERSASIGRTRNSNDPLLRDFMLDGAFTADLPAGDYQAVFYTGDEDAGGDFKAALYTDYVSAENPGKLLKESESIRTAAANYGTVTVPFTIRVAKPVTMKLKGRMNALILEQIVPLKEKARTIEDLRELVEAIEEVEMEESDYTAASWAAYRQAEDAAKAILVQVITNHEAVGEEEITAAYQALDKAFANLADMTGLWAAIAAAGRLDETEYTPESYAAVMNALAAANQILAKENATKEELDAAAAALNNAIESLVKKDPSGGEETKADKSKLDAAILAAGNLAEADYTPESYAKVTEALAEANRVKADDNAEQAEVDVAAKALNNAIASLVKKDPSGGEETKADKSKLDAAILAAGNLAEADYTPESYAKVTEALAEANRVKADDNAEQAEVDVAAKALNNAIASLVKKDPSGGEETKADKSKLDAAILAAGNLAEADYTPESYAKVTEALAEATRVKADETATQAVVDAAAKALNDAIAGLVKKTAGSSGTTGNTPAKGEKLIPASGDLKASYIVTSTGKNKTVEYKGTKAAKAVIPATVKGADGTIYKVTSIATSACKGSKQIKSVTIGSNVTKIGKNAFANCTKLENVTIGKSVTSIGVSAFSGNKKLTTVKFGAKVTSIGSGAFKGCTSLKTVSLPNSVKTIGANAFSGCTTLKKVTMGTTKKSALQTIGKSAFRGDTKLGTVVIKSTKVKSIGAGAFKNIKKTAKFTVPKNKKKNYTTYLKKAGVTSKMKIIGK